MRSPHAGIATLGLIAIFLMPQAASWRLVPDLVLDAQKENFGPEIQISIAPNRSIAVLQGFDRQVWLYDSTGKRTATMGRRGEGPGEFGDFSNKYGWTRDSLWVFDRSARRIAVFSPSNSFVRFEELPTPRSLTNPATIYSQASPLGRLPGSVLVGTAQISNRAPDATVASIVATINSSGIIQRTLAQLPSISQSGLTVTTATGLKFVTIPFLPAPLSDISSDGTRYVWVTTSLGAGTNAGVNVTMIRSGGDTAYTRTIQLRGVPIPRAVVDSTLQEYLRTAPTAEQKRAYETIVRDRVPRIYEPVNRVFVALDGKLWLRTRSDGLGRRWQVLSADGRTLTLLEASPPDVALEEADDTHVWATRSDSMALVSVVRFRIDRRR